MTAYVVFNAIQDKKLALDQKLPVSQARLGRAQGRRLADVHRHDDDADRRRTAARR
jgi:D-alanyl-D-alanine carboxypeptidase